ncbi:MAG: hypothetical protein WA139_00355 [Candidatus Aenigmatarchaeota archaeon]
MSKLQKEIKSIESQIKKKFGSELVSLIHIGSSLRPKEMFSNSDIDFVAVVKKKPKDWFTSVDSSYETNILAYSKHQFRNLIKEGSPVPLMAVKFGKTLFDNNFLKFDAKPTEKTIETWVQNGFSIFSSAIMEFFAAGCVCCYLKDTHHSARSFLRAQILKEKGILCESDKDIIKNTDDDGMRRIFEKLINFRKNLISFPFDFMKLHRMKKVSGKSAEPLLLLEQLMHEMAFRFYEKKMHKLSEIINKIEVPFDRIHSIFLTTKDEGKESYFVSIIDKKDKLQFMEFPLYKY